MSQDIIKEGVFLLHSVAAGLLLIFVYDVLRIVRSVIHHGTILMAVEDLLYWLSSSVFIFFMLYQENNGVIRWFAIVGVVVGMLVYNLTISPLVVSGCSFVLHKMGALLCFIGKYVSIPFRFVFRKVVQVMRFSGKKCSKVERFGKKRLKKSLRMVKIVLKRH